MSLAELDQLTTRPVQPDAPDTYSDFEYAYRLMRRTTETYVTAQAGEWPDQELRTSFRKSFDDPGMRIILLSYTPIGCYCISEGEDGIRLSDVYIDPQYQNQGLGRHIFQMALETAHEKKLPLELEVLRSNEPAINFWQNRGFYVCGDHQKGWLDELMMRSRDTDKYMPGAAFRIKPPQMPHFKPC